MSCPETHEEYFVTGWGHLQEECHDIAREKGWWDEPRRDGEIIALIHSELSECLEAMRNGYELDDKIPEFSGVEAELADAIIRIMDFAGSAKLRVAEAILAKMEYNRSRPHKHGGKVF